MVFGKLKDQRQPDTHTRGHTWGSSSRLHICNELGIFLHHFPLEFYICLCRRAFFFFFCCFGFSITNVCSPFPCFPFRFVFFLCRFVCFSALSRGPWNNERTNERMNAFFSRKIVTSCIIYCNSEGKKFIFLFFFGFRNFSVGTSWRGDLTNLLFRNSSNVFELLFRLNNSNLTSLDKCF